MRKTLMEVTDFEIDGDLPRKLLQSVKSVQHVIDLIRKSKKIIVITGAGISVSSGIPDFRSKDVGLYNTLDCDLYNIPSAELLFDYEFFRIDAEPFYKFASKLIPDENIRPSPCHNFIAGLEARGKLLRNYTQNVDGLERKAGISRVIECHGSMMNFRCMDCKRRSRLEDVRKDVTSGAVVYCRSSSCGGILKPDITFFGEELPDAFFKAIKQDVSKCDLVIVIGTSLKVGGSVHLLLKHVEDYVPQILINREAVTPPAHISGGFDVSLLGECDQVTRYLCSRLEWISDLSFRTIAEATSACDDITNQEECIKNSPSPVIKTSRKRQQVSQKHPPSIPASSSLSLSLTSEASSRSSDSAPSCSDALQQNYQYSEVSDRIFRVHREPSISCLRISVPSIVDQTHSQDSDIKPIAAGCPSSSAGTTAKQVTENPRNVTILASADEVVLRGGTDGGATCRISESKRSAFINGVDAPPHADVANKCRAVTRSLANKGTTSSSSPHCSLRTDEADRDVRKPVKIEIETQRRGLACPPKSSATVQISDGEVAVKRKRGRPKKSQPP